jgi:hypothetical protein
MSDSESEEVDAAAGRDQDWEDWEDDEDCQAPTRFVISYLISIVLWRRADWMNAGIFCTTKNNMNQWKYA